ncbi:flocculation protein FLO11 [Aplysia californica]|uniref:Flocculation protein FLO11 n=1 Tax=Aplysia californica TaxID=6500 RepID=A0ABM0JTG4_APLCA|nr:flocculation protein FLO11 [Aplysia californica]
MPDQTTLEAPQFSTTDSAPEPELVSSPTTENPHLVETSPEPEQEPPTVNSEPEQEPSTEVTSEPEQEPSAETVNSEPEQEPSTEVTSEPEQEPSTETVNSEPEQEPTTEANSEPEQEPSTETVNFEPEQEPSTETVNSEPEQEPSTETTSEPEQEPSTETTSQPEQEPSTETVNSEPEQEPTTEANSEPEQEPSSENTTEPEEEPSNETTSEPEQEPSTESVNSEPEQEPSTESVNSEPEQEPSTEQSTEPENALIEDSVSEPEIEPLANQTDPEASAEFQNGNFTTVSNGNLSAETFPLPEEELSSANFTGQDFLDNSSYPEAEQEGSAEFEPFGNSTSPINSEPESLFNNLTEPEDAFEPDPESEGSSEINPEPVGEGEEWPEPGPDWSTALDTWGFAWPFHISFTAFCFILVTLSAILVIILSVAENGWRRSSKSVITLSLLILSFALTRAIFLCSDAYGHASKVSMVFLRIVFSVGLPGFTASFSNLLLIILDTTKSTAGPPRFLKLSFVLRLYCVHLCVVVVVDVLVFQFQGWTKIALFLCQLFFILYGLLASVGFFYAARILKRNLAASKGMKDGLQSRLSFLRVLSYACGVVATVLAVVNMYAAVGDMGVFSEKLTVGAWQWWAVTTTMRTLEIAACVLVLAAFMNTSKASVLKGGWARVRRRMGGLNTRVSPRHKLRAVTEAWAVRVDTRHTTVSESEKT